MRDSRTLALSILDSKKENHGKCHEMN